MPTDNRRTIRRGLGILRMSIRLQPKAFSIGLAGAALYAGIAHRLSTAEAADEVLVFDRGAIVQRGPHAELVAERSSVYAGLHASWISQSRRERLPESR